MKRYWCKDITGYSNDGTGLDASTGFYEFADYDEETGEYYWTDEEDFKWWDQLGSAIAFLEDHGEDVFMMDFDEILWAADQLYDELGYYEEV